MKKRSIQLVCSGLILFALTTFIQAQNPVIFADVPDISIVRVGDSYYMSSTTMHMSPGVPVMRSKDLVNWEIVNYACNKLGDIDALTLNNGRKSDKIPYGIGID